MIALAGAPASSRQRDWATTARGRWPTRSPTRRCDWRRRPATTWAIAMAALTRRDGRRQRRELRERVERAAVAAGGRRQRLPPRRPARLGRLRGAVLRQRSRRDRARRRAIPIMRDSTTRSSGCCLRGNAGLAALMTGDIGAARAAFREELALCRELVRPAVGVRRPCRTRRARGARRRPRSRRAARRRGGRAPLRRSPTTTSTQGFIRLLHARARTPRS